MRTSSPRYELVRICRARLHRALGVLRTDMLRSEAGIGLVEAVMAMTIFIIASTALSDVLTSSVNAHGHALQQTLGQEAADAQIEDVRSLPYDSVGTTSGNPPGSVAASQTAATLGVSGLPATVTTSIHYVGDGVPGGYNQLTNYKKIVVTVTRNSDDEQLAAETTFIAPPTRAPYGGINQVALGVTVTDIGDNTPVSGVPIALQTGPSAPRGDTTDDDGAVLFAGLTANPTSGATAYYNVAATLPSGYVEMTGDTKQVQLNPGQLSNLALRVYQPATIIVNLTKSGVPYTGAVTVTVTPPSGTPSNYTITGGSGSVPNLLPNGQYSVSAATADGLLATAISQSVPNSYPTDLTSTFNVELVRPNGTVSVTATNGGVPIAGATITVSGGPDSITMTGTTDANGVANFPTVPAGTATYTVSGSYGAATFQQTGVVVSANGTTNVSLGVPAGSVKATVTSGGNPVPGATVTLTGPNGFSAVGTTDGSGIYTFANVGTGSGYTVTAADGAATASQGSVAVTTGATKSVGLTIATGSVKATVTDGTNPLAGALVTLTGPNSLSLTGVTNAAGVYTFAAVGVGAGYTVTAANGAATVTSGSLSVTSGTATNVGLTLAQGSIAATVTAGGVTMAGATVSLTGPNFYAASGTTNSSGIATFTNVGAGTGYTLSTTYGPASVQQTPVTVTSGSTTPVALAIPVGSVQVTVTAGGSGLQGAIVSLTGGGYTATPGTTSASGVYTFANVPAGSAYTVSAVSGGGTVTQSPVIVTSTGPTPVALTMPSGSFRAIVTIGATALSGRTVTLTGPHSYSATATTDSGGYAFFTNVPTGTGYTLTTIYGTSATQLNQTITTGAQTNVPLVIPSGSLAVTVKNQSGTTLSGVALTLGTTNGITAPGGTTSGSGTYTFTTLPAGTGYTVTAVLGGATVTSSSQTITNNGTTNLNVTVATGSILVTVKNQSNTSLQGAALSLAGSNGYSAVGTTTASGTYTFTMIPVGSGYTVTATLGGGTVTSGSATVTSGSTTNVSITLPTGTVAITVSQGGSGLSGASVTLTGSNGWTATASANGSGVASFSNVPAGSGYSAATTSAAAAASGTVPAVTSGATTNYTLTIPVGSIQVTVKNSSGGCAVRSNKTVTLVGPNGYSAPSGTTNGSGVYTFTNVPAGAGYTVSSVGNGSATVTVTAGQTKSQTISAAGTC
ncbi:MAG TPA: carboxypeptidase-like regulatory domain-containing protein [Gaiellaceae bacterium]